MLMREDNAPAPTMWIVRLALRRPYTFTVMALLILILGALSVVRMAKDIFPSIDIPVVTVLWVYGGLTPEEMEKRIVTISERAMTTTVNDIEHIESQSLPGAGIIKVFFQPGTSIDAAVAQVTAINQTVVRIMPPGTTPPLVIRFSASNVPILQLGLGSKSLTEQALYDIGLNFLRAQLATVQGASVPLPMGGKVRQIQVDLDPRALEAKGLTPADVTNAINAQNLTLPSGTAKIGDREYNVLLNSSPDTVAGLNDLPVKVVNGTTIYIRDVAQVRDGNAPQTNIVRQNGTRGALLPILKSGSASTLDIIKRVREALPRVLSTLPPELDLQPQFDQSIFVRAALNGVLHEALIATVLTSLMILLFLGTWRNTLVVALSIPLSIFCSLIVLSIFGQTINAMTLGGLALAVGILVDDATVTIENIDRNLGLKKPLIQAILDGAEQIATPAFVSTLCICIVFVPIFMLEGTAKYLFGPLAMAVIFAMLASYFLSRTVVPTFVHYLLHGQPVMHDNGHGPADGAPQGDIFWRVHVRFNRHFERFRAAYTRKLDWCLNHRKALALGTAGLLIVSAALLPFLGRDFFPIVDAGQFRLHVRAPAGTRIEETERIFTQVENVIREIIPSGELGAILDNIGLPAGSTALAFSDSVTVGAADGEILVSLNPEKHGSTWEYVRKIRARLNHDYPDYAFFTQPSDIVGQILNFGLPAPIDVQIAGRDRAANYALAQQLATDIAKIRGAVDVHVHQVVNAPALKVNVDRTRASQLGLTQRDVASNLLISLSGSAQSSPNYWLSPQNGVQYLVATQTPQPLIDSIDALNATTVGFTGRNNTPQILGNVASVDRAISASVVGHYNIQPVFDVYANVDQRDLGSVAAAVRKLIKEYESKLPRGSFITLRGQVQSMDASFLGLGIGVLFAILLVYLLMVVNFQSWLDPFIIIMALPGALCGIVWILFLTRTTLSVPSLMGAIMSVGVATANSILLVTFANDLRKEGKDARAAALEAGHTRLRPVLMTALAMIIGMLPMSLGLGEGGEQNAPLGRAVIGGLLVATLATLFLVPVVYATLRKKAAHRPEETISEELADCQPAPIP
jgi:multidrug efflux pump subunit AcrB